MENGSVKFISGIWLFFLASISVFFVVYSLSAYQIQARIQAFSAGDQTFSVWRIKRLSNRLKERKALIAPASIAVQNTRNEIADVQRKIDEASQQKQSAESERDKYVREIVTYIRRAAGPDFDLAGFNSRAPLKIPTSEP
jgi:biopolymer transport protein ExbB/TolQ